MANAKLSAATPRRDSVPRAVSPPIPVPKSEGESRLRVVPVVVAFIVILAFGVLDAIATGRYEQADSTLREAMDAVPTTVGEWSGTEVEQNSETFPDEFRGQSILRRYADREGHNVLVFLNVRARGPQVAAHSPESCYPGAGFKVSWGPEKKQFEIGPNKHEFLSACFSKTSRADPEHVKVYWSWSGDGLWQTPEKPRVAFAKYRNLYKLYVIRQLTKAPSAADDSNDPAESFIKSFVLEMDKILHRDQ